MPSQAQIPTGGSRVPTQLYSGRVEVVKCRILVGEDSLPVATKFEVNARFNGQYFVNARLRPVGSLPNGISWASSPQGIRFFGVPQQFGTFEALFEGPYPNHFVGTSTSGDYAVDECHSSSQAVSPGIQVAMVFGWVIRFIVTPKTANSISFAAAWRNLLLQKKPALTVYREEWGSGGGSGPGGGGPVFAAMRLIGDEFGNWQIPNSLSMSRQGAPAGYDWTLVTNVSNLGGGFKFLVGITASGVLDWDDPSTQIIENWGENDLPGTAGYYIGDQSGANIQFSQAAPAGSQAGQYRFSFNETTFAYIITAVGGGGSGLTSAPEIQGPNPWQITLNQGQAFTLSIVASGSPSPTFAATGLPQGLSISSAGVISGSATGVSGLATITASNSVGVDSRQIQFTILVQTPTSVEISFEEFQGGQMGFVKNPTPVLFQNGGGTYDIWYATVYPGFTGPSKAYWVHGLAIPVKYALYGGASIPQEFTTDGGQTWRQYVPPSDLLSIGNFSSPLAIRFHSGNGSLIVEGDQLIVGLRGIAATSNMLPVTVVSVSAFSAGITPPAILSVVPGNGSLTISFTQSPVIYGGGSLDSAVQYYEYSVDAGVTWRGAPDWADQTPFTIDQVSARNAPLVNGIQYQVQIRAVFFDGRGQWPDARVVSRPSNTVLAVPT